MTEIKIFVVKTELQNNNANLSVLEWLKLETVKAFGGLTVLADNKGYWLDNSTNKLCIDQTDIWLIETSDLLTKNLEIKLEAINLSIKTVTKQLAQLYTIGGIAHLC